MSCIYEDYNSSTYNPEMIKNCEKCANEKCAEKQALKEYPPSIVYSNNGNGIMNTNAKLREAFIKGSEWQKQQVKRV